MVKFDYSRPAAAARRMIERFGRRAILRKARTGTYNPATSTAPTGQQDFSCTGVLLNYEQKDVDGTVIQQGDQRFLMLPELLLDPATGDTLIVDRQRFIVIVAKATAPIGDPILYELQIRGVGAGVAAAEGRWTEGAE